jgi:Fe-S-cluster containining protein
MDGNRDLQATVDDVIRGLVYTHNRANANTAELHQASAAVEALTELLIERGVLDRETVQARQREAAEKLRGQYLERGMGVAMQDFAVSKYAFQGGATIDCENRVQLCKASCCKLPFALSKEDVQEGKVRWDLGRPYMVAQGGDGYCAHMDREKRCCSVYAQRPIPCRGYDCRKDKRIWLDFEKRVVNPQINEPDWPACLERQSEQEAGKDV